jgi:hypothetical protein
MIIPKIFKVNPESIKASFIEMKFKYIAKNISAFEIQSDLSGVDLSLDDLFHSGKVNQSSPLFLGKYSSSGIDMVNKRFGFYHLARRKGLRNLKITIQTNDPFRHILRVYNNNVIKESNLVFEFIARFQTLIPPSDSELKTKFPEIKVLYIEWLNLQNPIRSFSKTRPPLPGQKFPGLGMGNEILSLFTIMSRHLKVDALLNVPQYYHTALMFSKRFKFFNPYTQGKVQAISKSLWSKYRLAVIAWAADYECIRDLDSGEYFTWKAEQQIVPIHPKLKQYFNSDGYQNLVLETQEKLRFEIDEVLLKEKLKTNPNDQFSF